MTIYIYTSEILKTDVENRFFGTQYTLYLRWQVEKNCVKCAVYKISDVQKKIYIYSQRFY